MRRQSYLIGLVYEKPSPSYVVELQRGALERLHGERYRLIVLPVESVSDHPRDVVSTIRSAALDGVILAPPAADHPEVLDGLTQARIPFARITPQSREGVGLSTTMDDIAAGREIAQHVISFGHTRIAIIKGDPDHPVSEQRLTAYRAAFDDAGIALLPELVETGDFSFESGYEATADPLAQAAPDRDPGAERRHGGGSNVRRARTGLRSAGRPQRGRLRRSGNLARGLPRLTTVRQPVVDGPYRRRHAAARTRRKNRGRPWFIRTASSNG